MNSKTTKEYQEAFELMKIAHEQEMPCQTPDSRLSDAEEWSSKLIEKAKKICYQAVKDYLSVNDEIV